MLLAWRAFCLDNFLQYAAAIYFDSPDARQALPDAELRKERVPLGTYGMLLTSWWTNEDALAAEG